MDQILLPINCDHTSKRSSELHEVRMLSESLCSICGHQTSCKESLRPRPSFQEAFADLNIVGLPKTGTTQLYEILASHPNVILSSS